MFFPKPLLSAQQNCGKKKKRFAFFLKPCSYNGGLCYPTKKFILARGVAAGEEKKRFAF